MSSTFKTEQETFWAEEFGQNYISRNCSDAQISSNIALFSKILSRISQIKSVIEFGANIGLNLRAIRYLCPSATLSAIEINPQAAAELQKIEGIQVYHQSILDDLPDLTVDFVLAAGILIHVNPDFLEQVYNKLHSVSQNYICISEYYNPTPVEVPYRGYRNKLFKRDFAGEMLDRFPDLTLVDYGFVYHRDLNFPKDDVTWFLLKKATL